MNLRELQAIAQLLNKAPLSIAETEWVNEFIKREEKEIAALPRLRPTLNPQTTSTTLPLEGK